MLKDFAKPYIGHYVIAVFSLIGSNIFHVYIPKLIGEFTDELQQGLKHPSVIYQYAALVLAAGIGAALLHGVGQYTILRLGRQFEFHMRQKMFAHFLTLSENYFSKNGVGSLLSHIINDLDSIRNAMSFGMYQTTNAIFLMIFSLAIILSGSIPVHLMIVGILPLLLIPVSVVYFKPRIRAKSKQVQESLASMTKSVEEQLYGIRVIKAFAVEDVARGRFGETVDQVRNHQLRLVRSSSFFTALLPFVGHISLAVTLVYGGYLTAKGGMTLGDFVAFTLYLKIVVGPLQRIGKIINTTHKSRTSLDRLQMVLSEVPDIQESKNAIPLKEKELGIEVRQLTFAYPDSKHQVLNNINLFLAPGKTLGIVGRTGSGKTTLAKLLLRIYDSPTDSIRIGGMDIREVELASLRGNIAYVPQDGFLFSATIRENIAFSDGNLTMEQLAEASQFTHIYDDIMEFPEQFETTLGQRGQTLSGGQRQRMSLARGLIKNAPLLILDDSVSAVDSVTEKRIIESVRKSRTNRTTVIIAHRISAVQHADEIIVLDEGTIVQRGTHEQLLAAGGNYASLHAIQRGDV